MNIRIARYFVSIAQFGSMREAAATLNVAQPALSRAIMNLETDLGMPLLERHSRGVKLTAAGEIFLRHARDELTQAEQLRGDLDALKGLRRGTVSVYAIESFARSFLPALIASFWEHHPEISFNVMTQASDNLITAVRDGLADIGLTYNSLMAPGVNVRLRVREPLVALVSSSHPLAGVGSVTMRDAASFPAALVHKPSRSRLLIDEACREEGVSLTIALETNSVEHLVRLAAHGHTVTFLLRHSATDELRSGVVRMLQVRNPLMMGGTVEILTRASRSLSPASEEFTRIIAAALQANPAPDFSPG